MLQVYYLHLHLFHILYLFIFDYHFCVIYISKILIENNTI